MKSAKMEVVYLPSAQHATDPERPEKGYTPGQKFMAFTSEAIRRINLMRWKSTPFQQKKMARTPGTAEDIRAALATAQAGSLAHRGYGRQVAA